MRNHYDAHGPWTRLTALISHKRNLTSLGSRLGHLNFFARLWRQKTHDWEQNRFLVSSITNRRFSLYAIKKWNIKTVQCKSPESGNEEENMQRPLPRLRSGPAYARYSEKWFFLIHRALYEDAMLVPIGMDTNVAAGNFLLRKLEFISRENHENYERKACVAIVAEPRILILGMRDIVFCRRRKITKCDFLCSELIYWRLAIRWP